MNRILFFIISVVFLLPACDWFTEDLGADGQPCFGNDTCKPGYFCCANGLCRESCDNTTDGDVDFSIDGDTDSVSDGDSPDSDTDTPTDGDAETEVDGDTDEIEGDNPTDGDVELEADGDQELDEDPEGDSDLADEDSDPEDDSDLADSDIQETDTDISESEDMDIEATFCTYNSGPCCDNATNTLHDENYLCSEEIDDEYGCPSGFACSQDVKHRYKDRFCDALSSLCIGEEKWRDWTLADNCLSHEVCVSGQAVCKLDRKNCDPSWCDAGVCCNVAITTFHDTNQVCETGIPGDDYRCVGAACGDDVEVKYQDRYCDGISSSCNGRLEDSSTWGELENCTTSQRCHPTNFVCEAYTFHDAIQCDGLDRYYYNDCGVREEFIENCADADNCTIDSCSESGCTNTTNTCHNHGVCNSGDGTCNCDNTRMDADCSACEGGYSGYPDCLTTEGFVSITAGSFWMGSPESTSCPSGYPGICAAELGRTDREALHEVTLTYDFEIQAHELTQGEWISLMTWNPVSHYDSGCSYGCGDNHPVKYVSWFDVLAYANKLSENKSLTACYVFSYVECEDGTTHGSDYMGCMNVIQGGIDSAEITLAGGASKPQECEGYRLPTEAEWEYAIRAGNQYTAFYQSAGNDGTITYTGTSPIDPNLTQIGWFGGNNSPSGTKPVGGKEGNAWGLYDMSGNVLEWAWDWYRDDYDDVATDPVGPSTGSDRILRGGYWAGGSQICRSALRHDDTPGARDLAIGVRLSRSHP